MRDAWGGGLLDKLAADKRPCRAQPQDYTQSSPTRETIHHGLPDLCYLRIFAILSVGGILSS